MPLFLLLCVVIARGTDQIPLIPTYDIGEIAVSDVIAPISFAIPNPEETRRLKESETEQSPRVFRHLDKVAAGAELSLAEAFAQQRARFLAWMQQSAKRPVLDEATVDHPSFAKFVAWYQERNKSFPLSMSLARTWALGHSDELIVGNLVERLQGTMTAFICSEPFEPDDTRRTIRIVETKSPNASVSLTQILSGKEYPADELYTLDRAQEELETGFSDEQRSWGRFLADFVRPNCVFDAAASRRFKEHRLSKIAALDFYHPGDLIVSSGEVVDARMKRALDLLHQKRIEQDTRAASAQARREKVDSALAFVDRGLTAGFAGIEKLVRSQYHVPMAIGACLLLLLWLRQLRKQRLETPAPAATAQDPAYAVVVNRNRQETIFVPLSQTLSTASGNADVPTTLPAKFDFAPLPQEAPWEEKVLAAEQRADELMQLVRAGLAPHLAKHLASQFVRELMSQRHQLIQTQKLSESELTRLEAQFATVQAELIERLSSYELRNAELEKELADRRKENHDLIRMMMGLTRTQQEKIEAAEESSPEGVGSLRGNPLP